MLYKLLHNSALALFRSLGLTVRRNSPTTDDMMSLVAMLGARNVDVILDVGANRGQFAEKVFRAGYKGSIVSFEPLSRPRAILAAKSQGNARWKIADACCLGEQPGEVEIKISMNEIASSILDTTSAMAEYDGSFRYIGSETVPVCRLDDVAPEAKTPFLKVDVQGFETQVLRGALETLKKCVGVQVELSFVELYQGQMLFREMLVWLEDLGFTPYRLFPAYIDVHDGRWLQADVVFFRS